MGVRHVIGGPSPQLYERGAEPPMNAPP